MTCALREVASGISQSHTCMFHPALFICHIAASMPLVALAASQCAPSDVSCMPTLCWPQLEWWGSNATLTMLVVLLSHMVCGAQLPLVIPHVMS
jgi:hypothetical protein